MRVTPRNASIRCVRGRRAGTAVAVAAEAAAAERVEVLPVPGETVIGLNFIAAI